MVVNNHPHSVYIHNFIVLINSTLNMTRKRQRSLSPTNDDEEENNKSQKPPPLKKPRLSYRIKKPIEVSPKSVNLAPSQSMVRPTKVCAV